MSRNHKYYSQEGEKAAKLDFYEFIYDRQLIWHRRNVLRQPAPWTDEPIMQKLHFCNVYRELDKGSQHLIANVLMKADLTPEEKLYNALFYRRFNIYGFFGQILPAPLHIDEFNVRHLIELFDEHRALKRPIYNTAYNICQVPFDKSFRPKDKHVQLILGVLDAVKSRAFETMPWRADAIYDKIMDKAYGCGGFLSYQLMLDYSYIPGVVCEGLDEFVIVGPGAIGGLERLDLPCRPSEEADLSCRILWEEQPKWFKELAHKTDGVKNWEGIALKDPIAGQYPWLALSDIQNCLCEFRKYRNHKLSNGKRFKKRLYRAPERSLI